MDWLGFLGSILGGLIGGLFTFFGVHLTIKHSEKKEKEEAFKKINAEKPRLEITNFLNFDKTENGKFNDDSFNLVILEIKKNKPLIYDNKAKDSNNLVFVEYELINIGLTEISDICITSNYEKQLSIIEYGWRDLYIKEGLVNFELWLNKRYIKPVQTIKLRIYFVNGQVFSGKEIINIPILTLWLKDVNNNYWSQLLNVPQNEIETSKFREYADFIETRKNIQFYENNSALKDHIKAKNRSTL